MNRKKITSIILASILVFSSFGITAHAAATYTVKSGDVLWKIAASHDTTVDNLKKWNGLTSDLIYPGQALNVEQPFTTYKVKAGDTLYKISGAHGTTVQAIKTFNKLTSDRITIGQSLNIPTSPENVATIHNVQKGEYLYVIAQKYGTTVSEIKRLNGLTSDTIYVGQQLKVSKGL